MGADLNNIIKTQKLSDDHVQFLIYQIIRGMKYVVLLICVKSKLMIITGMSTLRALSTGTWSRQTLPSTRIVSSRSLTLASQGPSSVAISYTKDPSHESSILISPFKDSCQVWKESYEMAFSKYSSCVHHCVSRDSFDKQIVKISFSEKFKENQTYDLWKLRNVYFNPTEMSTIAAISSLSSLPSSSSSLQR